MENFFDIDPEGLTMSTRALQKVLKERGWTATFLRSTHQYVFAKRQDSKIFRIVGTVPESTSYVAGRIANDKLASYELLKRIGVKQAETEVATLDSVSRFLSRYGRIVIKPVDGAHGNGITTDITTSEAAIEAIETAKRFSYSGTAIVQEQLDLTGFETRVICIDYKFVEGLSRIPAYITGDGEHTVSELIDIENTTIRTEPYKSNLAFIDREYAEKYMAEKKNNNYVPDKGEKAQVIKMCNIGRGGTVEDITDSFSEEKRRLAEHIARTIDLPVIGIDFFGDYVLEVNAAPSLYYPLDSPRAYYGVEKLVDYLERS